MIRLEKRDKFYVYSSTLHKADVRHRAPVRPRQYPPPGILKTSPPVRLRQYPPPGIPKARPPVRLRKYPPPGIPKAVLQSIFANIPHQGY
ncbi:hypothetical protein PoB_006021900 [Plakobranchus ocellatus]|uniref:Uncharacterized protein n=1 Tax=Plakobranchus ocellatus TaxID=259542 RepID=A0AAV4CPE0_9GAST|nr:hypothetical protein PoB_006021900 [Plakobranchus ocellatus]